MDKALIDSLVAAGWSFAGWLLPIALSALAVYGIRYLRAQAQAIDAQRHDTVAYQIEHAAETAVRYAEQSFASGANAQKKQAALQFLQDYLDTRGIHLPVSQLVGQIESAVMTQLDHADPPAPIKITVTPPPRVPGAGSAADVPVPPAGTDDLSKLGLSAAPNV